jgi:enterobactin synthetase component D
MPTPFSTIYRTANHHGVIIGVSLPEPQRIPNNIWASLHPKERKKADQLKGYRKISYVGGRVAGHMALQLINKDRLPILMDPFGAPLVSNNVTISISHKKQIALAMVTKRKKTTIGIDIENLNPERFGISKKTLTQAELEYLETLPQSLQWGYVVLNFSTKESIFKALAPRLQRYISFEEAEVYPQSNFSTIVKLNLKIEDSLPSLIKARYMWYENSVITSVQVTW